jgi:1-acyl-sn-glycerol-3-phosphate acyltransferase
LQPFETGGCKIATILTFFVLVLSIIQDKAAGEAVVPEITSLEVDSMIEDVPPEFADDPRNQQRFVFHRTLVRRITITILKIVLPLMMKRDISGVENLPAEGPVVLAPNHLTNYDVFPIQVCLPRPLFFMAKAELHKNMLLDIWLRQMGAFPVERGAGDQWAIEHARKVLDHQRILAIFPEGTRSKGRGLRPAKTGAARFALYANCPIVPVTIHGTEMMFKVFPRRTHVKIQIGAPIYPKAGESPLALTDRIMFTLAEMLPVALRGVYAKRPMGF